MELLKCVVLVLVCLGVAQARGAGRAFPIDSENYVIDAFQRINRYIEWDETNFLVDLAGQYANCDYINTAGFIQVDNQTPEGSSIAAYSDDTYGTATDVNAVNSYIQEVVDRWTRDSFSELNRQIKSADRFGCSVRPGCNGQVSIACLFTPADAGGFRPPNIEEGGQDALAFTKDQYAVATAITGRKWGQDHLLENLSGFETSCAMLYQTELSFAMATAEAKKRRMTIVPLYGSAPNRGATEPAMIEVLKNMKEVSGSTKVGCSIIPDCIDDGGQMFVVVGCIFQI